MNRKTPLLVILLTVALISRYTELRVHEESPEDSSFERYAEWSIDGVRPGMSLSQAQKRLRPLALEKVVDYFGKRQRFYWKLNEQSYPTGFVVVDDQNLVIQVQGDTLQRHGKELSELPFPKDEECTFAENHCRATDILSHRHKLQFTNYPVAMRGPVQPKLFLGDDPEWLALCYRTDELGICLEGLEHVSSLIPDAKVRLKRYATNLGELPYYRTDKGLIHTLTCPLGGTYQVRGPTLTCFSHANGPISVTRIEKRIRFWQGAPGQ